MIERRQHEREIAPGRALAGLLAALVLAGAPHALATEPAEPTPEDIAALANLVVCGECDDGTNEEARQCTLQSPQRLLVQLPPPR